MKNALTFFFITLTWLSCQKQENDPTLLQVGKFSVTRKDLDYRNKIVQIFYPGNKTVDAGLIQLRNSLEMAAIMENNGHEINEHKLTNESARIDASTKDPKKLKEIKAIFKTKSGDFDENAYRKVFILPSYVDRNFTSFFQSLPLHEKTHAEAVAFYDEADLNSGKMLALGKEKKRKNGFWCVSRKEGISFEEGDRKKKKTPKNADGGVIDLSEKPNRKVYEEIRRQMGHQADAAIERWLSEIVAPTKVGSIVNKIIDYSESWLILRLIEKKSDEGCFEAVIFEKANYSDWLEAERKKINVITKAK